MYCTDLSAISDILLSHVTAMRNARDIEAFKYHKKIIYQTIKIMEDSKFEEVQNEKD